MRDLRTSGRWPLRRRHTVLLVGTAVVIGLGVLVVAGPPLPGPHAREFLGLKKAPPSLAPCSPRASLIARPSTPAPTGEKWRTEPRSPLSRTEMSGVAVNGIILTLAGQPPGGDVLGYDPRRRTYWRETKLPVAVDHSLVVAYRGRVYVVGGFLKPAHGELGGRPTAKAWRYDLSTHGWTELPSMHHARGALIGGVIHGRIYAVSGGANPFPVDRTPYRSVEVFDIATGRWTEGPPIPISRHHAASAVLFGKLYAVGGERTGDYSLASVERLDPATGRWQDLPPLPLGVGDPRAVAVAGRVLAIGGQDETGWRHGGGYYTPVVWAYDPHLNSWSRLADLREARHGFATAVVGRRVYVFEGSPCPGHGLMNTAESLRVGS